MQLTINGKKYTICYSVAATMCDDLLETVTSVVGAASAGDDTAQSVALAGKLPALTKSLMYGGLLQMHGVRGDGSVKSKKDAEDLLFDYLTENAGKREGTLAYVFNALYEQMGDDNFLAQVGLTENGNAPKGKKAAGGEN